MEKLLINNSFLCLVPKGAPRELKATALNNTAILITWVVPNPDDLDGNLTGYQVDYFGFIIDTDEKSVIINTTSLEDQSLILSQLEDFTVYEISVKAKTIGLGPKSEIQRRTEESG